MKGIITLCGSTRFKAAFEEVNRELTFAGYCVLSVGSFHHSELDHVIQGRIIERKVQLDVLHKEKIDMSFAIVVLNVSGYIGQSTRSEVKHAIEGHKLIYLYEPDKPLEGFYDIPTFGWKLLLR